MTQSQALIQGRVSPEEREIMLAQLPASTLDVLVIGAGINGAVAAAGLSARACRVAVVDGGDFSSGVSSQSSNLAWGGIKYLEAGEFRLVRKLCRSRNQLMDAFPSTVREIRFLASVRRGFRWWSIALWCGALLYWLMGNMRLSPPRYLTARAISRRAPVVNPVDIVGGLEYSDCYLHDNDSRFVFRFLRTAMDRGVLAANYTRVERLTWSASEDRWTVQLRDLVGNRTLTVHTKSIVNAAGPNADSLNEQLGVVTQHHHALSKGIHLIVDRVTDVDKVLTFFASDGRLFFVIPMGPKTCIGTTDTRVDAPSVSVTPEDRDFVLANANALLKLPRALTTADIIAERVGVRPLVLAGEVEHGDWTQLSRKHEIDVDEQRRVLSIFGGKLTDCINVGDEVVSLIAQWGLAMPKDDQRWYGEPGPDQRAQFLVSAAAMELDALTPKHAPEPLSLRYWRRYGTDAFELLTAIAQDPTESEQVLQCADYTRAELRLTARREMIVDIHDFLRRRSKIAQVVRLRALLEDPGLPELVSLLMAASAPAAIAQLRESAELSA